MPDYPDFTRYAYIDIIAQTIERVLARPTYGGAQVSTVVKAAVASADTEYIAIAGEGMIYGGCIAVWGGMTQENCMWLSNIDGNAQCPAPFNVLAGFNMGQPHGTSPIMTRYDMVNFQYGFILPYGITFEESAVFSYREAHGDTPTVLMVMTYALV